MERRRDRETEKQRHKDETERESHTTSGCHTSVFWRKHQIALGKSPFEAPPAESKCTKLCSFRNVWSHHMSPLVGPARAIDAVALHSDLRQLDAQGPSVKKKHGGVVRQMKKIAHVSEPHLDSQETNCCSRVVLSVPVLLDICLLIFL